MACVSNVRYVVIINSFPTRYFGVGRGLRQGCSLSPLLFILAMDVLNYKTKNACMEGEFNSLKVGSGIRISHSSFVDDILIFGMISRMVWATLHYIFFKFGRASGLLMNNNKLVILFEEGSMEDI